ncbi:MAG: trigger factor [Proteobacteria bacterium]|nr:trigger factor [Pseudomonadota bacterium]MBU1716954.1 trigger factor [Pseudomonadota bacterium]
MQVTVEEVSSLTRKMKIVLSKEDVAPKIEDAYRKLASEVSIKGFRKGKVPRKVLEKNYAPKVKSELGEKLVQETYFDALSEVKLDAVVHPDIRSISFEDDGSFVYEAEVDVRPQFELGAYTGLEVEQQEILVSDADVDAELERIRKEMAPLRSVDDRGIKNGDVAVLKFEGFHEGKEMDKVKADDFSVDVGAGRLGKEFEENLVGLAKGEKTEREIDFPVSFGNQMLAGKKVNFKIEVKDIKERALPEFDDEFAKDVGENFKTLADLKKHISEQRRKTMEEVQSGDFSDKIMLKLLDNHDFEVPPRLVAYEVNNLITELENNLTNQNMTLESAGMNRDSLVEQYKDTAQKRVKGDFILKKIAEKEEIKLVDEDIENGFKRIAEKYEMAVADVKKYFSNRDDLLPFMNELLSEKILKFLRDAAEVKIVPVGSADAAKKETVKGEAA